ncbi:ABC transporter ATP-binding protein [Breznakia pachnodae]|uniref:ATP-binding cassette subfamily B protein n=1 Tax=Breznakia pachnodae TaxID=265178 RepID=A0ABU0E631_9FIRM|nr:ABC transporter ATP-binding protein [Breznakia pachnodae]MDQ0362250.1 ATP-binding cassette subfamily B protein [Breznakia pachnodae]
MFSTIKKFFAFAGKQKQRLQRALLVNVISSFFQALQLVALSIVLQAVVRNEVTMTTVWTSLGIMLVSIVGVIIFGHNSRMNDIEASFDMCSDKRIEIGERMKYMPMGYFNANSLGSITATLTNTMEDLQNIAPRVMENTMHGFIHGGIITIMILFVDWRMSVIIVLGVLLFLCVNRMMQKKSSKASPIRVEAQRSLVGAILEYVQGMGVVRAFDLVNDANKTIDRAIEHCENQNVSMEFAFIPFMFVQSTVLKFVSVVIIISSLLFYLNGSMTLENCMLMMVASFLVFSKIEQAGSMSALLRSIDIGMDKIEEINQSPTIDIDGKDITPTSFTIEGKDVQFAYGNKVIIQKESFIIPEKTTTAIVGPSGSGKTTLCNLIARFWDVNEGSITIGGHDVKKYTLDSLLANISMVFQNVYLFNDSIINNIRFGKPDATKEEVIEAAKKACCHDFIEALPEGYDTIIGEGGATVSGGEKQRISIARAILKDAPIIILDEATANVDPENESRLQMAIEELTKNKTIIMIAHRLKTVQNANQILVLDEGHIVQRGTHDELMKNKGIYSDFIKVREQAIGWKL